MKHGKPTVQELDDLRGQFVVMRYTRNAKRMHVSVIHDTYGSAKEEAQRLFAAKVAEGSNPEFVRFYILAVQGGVGFFNGTLESGE